MSSNIREARRDVQELTVDVQRFNRVLDLANLKGATVIGILASMGLPADIQASILIFQSAIIAAETLSAVLTKLEIQMGPVGWALIGLGFVAAPLLQQMRSRQA